MSAMNDRSYIVKPCGTGRGVFAALLIPADSVIMSYTGPLLRYHQTTSATLALQIGPDLYIGESGQADDFVNHSCQPNAGMRIDGTDVQLIALRDIPPGEQITFDYSTTMDEDDFEFDCLCGSQECRGKIRDFKHLPAELREAYARRGIVPEYNRRFIKSATSEHA
jgi:SET domain-containing protein